MYFQIATQRVENDDFDYDFLIQRPWLHNIRLSIHFIRAWNSELDERIAHDYEN